MAERIGGFLCGSLRIFAFSALTVCFNTESAKIERAAEKEATRTLHSIAPLLQRGGLNRDADWARVEYQTGYPVWLQREVVRRAVDGGCELSRSAPVNAKHQNAVSARWDSWGNSHVERLIHSVQHDGAFIGTWLNVECYVD